MLTCGHYDASGDFAYKVGLQEKWCWWWNCGYRSSKMSICVYSPKLNAKVIH